MQTASALSEILSCSGRESFIYCIYGSSNSDENNSMIAIAFDSSQI